MKQNITFDPQLKNADYLADYFIKTKTILEAFKPNQNVTMQYPYGMGILLIKWNRF
jgi:hypothetical protein